MGAAARRRRDRPQSDDLPRTALRAVLCGREGAPAGRGDRRYHQHPGHRARQLSSPGGVFCARQMGQRRKVRRAHAAGQMLPRHGSHHVAEKRRRAPAGCQLRQRLSVRPGQEARRRGQAVPGGLRHRGKLPVLGQKALHRPSGPLELLCVGLPGASGKAHH
ncbi:Uncharacterised protein [uncultured Clostridium sp.]